VNIQNYKDRNFVFFAFIYREKYIVIVFDIYIEM